MEKVKVKGQGQGESRGRQARCIPVLVKTTTRVWRAFRTDERELVSETTSEEVKKITRREFLRLAFIRFGRV